MPGAQLPKRPLHIGFTRQRHWNMRRQNGNADFRNERRNPQSTSMRLNLFKESLILISGPSRVVQVPKTVVDIEVRSRGESAFSIGEYLL